MTYAIFQNGGKQYRAEVGNRLKLEKLPQEFNSEVVFDDILFVGGDTDEESKIGSPQVEGAQIHAKILSHGRHQKIRILKFKRRKHHMKRMGHRQWFTEVEITKIS